MAKSAGRRLIRCDRTIQCSAADLMVYVAAGWPKCCGETMALFIEAPPPVPPPDPES